MRASEVSRYLGDAAFRRQALEASLVNPQNTYARLRLESYTEDGWGRLPLWNPRSTPVLELNAEPPSPEALGPGMALLPDDAGPQALLALGEQAFFRYPMQPGDYWRGALEGVQSAQRYGLWSDESWGVGGLMWVALPDGSVETAATCATCHAAPVDGQVVAGLGNPLLDVGALTAHWYGQLDSPSRAWGPGRLDVTGDGVENPVTIADLRGSRSQQHLHRTATLHNDLVALAIRIETLLITSHGQALRPPRQVAMGLALYLYQGMEPEPVRAPDELSRQGRLIFERLCVGCHSGPGGAGPAVPVEAVGGDAAVALSPARATGYWRVPSLRGVAQRGRLFADGQTEGLSALFEARGDGEQAHPFGLELDNGERLALIAYLETF